ncbi:DoxX family protein [Rhodococcus globerulus]|uniref:DoxX family protein n=1 Tax=Rhodococcus globerulus TaxID=33008 RepID=UPI00301899A5
MLVRRIARPLLSTIFIAGGIDALRNPAQRAAKATPLIDKSVETLPGAVTQKMPADPETLIKLNAVIQIGGGALLATGKAPRIASLALAGSLIPTTVAGHDFWNESDPTLRAMQRTNFIKNVSLLGGLMIAAVDTEGKPSLGWRGRHAARKAQASIAATLPLAASNHDDHTGERLEHALAVASERGTELAEAAKVHGAEFLDIAKERGPEILEVAQKRGAELAETARERGSELAELAGKRSAEFAELALEKSNEWAETASEQSEVLGKRARKRAEIALAKAREKRDELTH